MFWLAFQTPTRSRRSDRIAAGTDDEIKAPPPAEEEAVMMSGRDRQQRIRERAYQIWLDEGCPHGREQIHWRRAEIEIDAESAQPG
jgi:hypothetical protein